MPDKSSSLRKFWARLQHTAHPDDEPVFNEYPRHTFKLEFPPSAFVGDIDAAPILILMSNGGYKQGITETEFPDDSTISEYRRYIRGELTTLPQSLGRYYKVGQIGNWIATGMAALVNAVPYRSAKLSAEPLNVGVANRLLSLAAHRRWIMEEVLPDALRGNRLVLVHRNGWWRIPQKFAGPCVIFSDPARAEPNRQAPDREKLDLAQNWLVNRHR